MKERKVGDADEACHLVPLSTYFLRRFACTWTRSTLTSSLYPLERTLDTGVNVSIVPCMLFQICSFFEETFMVDRRNTFWLKYLFFLKIYIYICFQVFSKSVRSSRGLFNLKNSIYMYIFFYLIFDLMKVRRKFTNFIFMQDIRQINSKVNDFRMRFFSVPNFPSE